MKRLTFIMLALFATAGRVSAQESVSVNDVTVRQGGEALVEINYSLKGTDPYVGFFFQVDLPEGLSLVEGADEGYPWYDPDVEAIKKLSITTTATGFAATPKTAEATINGTSGVLMRIKVAADESVAIGTKFTVKLSDVSFNVLDENFNVTPVELDNVSFDVTVVTSTATMGDPIEAIAIDNINTYTGSEPYVYSKANMTYYALNSLGEYEEYGVFTEVSTLKAASGGVSEIEYIATTSSMSTMPYINTGYVHKANTRIVMECDIDGSRTNNYQAPFGSRAGYDNKMYVFFWRFNGNNKGCFARNAEVEGTGGANVPTGEKIKVDASGVTLNVYKDGETDPCVTIAGKGNPQDGTTPMYIFDLCHVDHADNSATLMKLYTFKIYEGDNLVMDLVPAVNSEGKGGLKDKLTGTFYGSANSAEFELSADGQAMAGQAGIPVYEGKRVKLTTDNHEYKYQDGQWLDCGEMALEEITDQTYKDMRNWETNNNHMSIFAGFTYDGTTNEINPYVGTGGFEPYMFKIETIAGEDYNWSFIYSGSAYGSWHSTEFHAYVANDYNLNTTETGANYNDNVIGIAEAFPFAGVENKPYSIDFTAKQNNETLVVQFGDVDDGKEFWFKFANLKVSRYVYPLAYEPIDFVVQDDNKYTPLAYIESTGATRENAFTLPYNPRTATQIDAKFQVYDTSTGWCGIFSARNTYAGTGISLYMNNDRAHFGYFTGSTTGAGDNFAPFSFNTDYEVQADVTKLVLNGKTYNTGNTVTNATTRQLSLFANPEWDNPMRGRFYYCNISEVGEAVYNFKPVMRHDGKFGFYDKDSRAFVMPAQGKLDGYNFATIEGESYIYFTTEPRSVFIGFTEKYEPTVQNVDGATFTWTSSNTDVATVAADGTVTGIAKGTVTITATDTNSDWVASYTLDVEPATVAADHVEVWDGNSDAIVGSIRWSGDSYKPAYTITFDSGEGFGDWNTSNPKFNVIYGVPEADENEKAWYEADFTMTTIWSYNSDVLPSGWPSNPGEVYVRRYFKAEGELPAQLYMPAPHDDAPCEYYINGTLVWSRTGNEPGVNGWYEDEIVKLNAEQRALIKTDGSVNVFAYHVHQNWGDRYADGGIYGNSMAENSPSAKFEGNQDRKRLASALAQAEGVEGIDADVLTYAKNANVCLQDAGRALSLIRWELRKALSPRHNYTFASAEPTDGLECWLYNVGAGQFLAGSNDWGTHASLDYNISSWPMVLRANSSGENRFAIQTNLPNGRRGANDGLGHNGYVDCSYGDDFTTDEDWAWTFEAVGNGNYRIIQSGTDRYLGMTEDERYQVDTDKTGANNLYNQWKVVTREQLDALAAAATPENPADVSYFIHQNTFSQNDFDGDNKDTANGDLNDSRWDCNAGSIWNWKGNDVNGDHVFEIWNTAGKVYLKQTIEGLPAGKYIVECTGYYRDGSWNDAIAGNIRQLAYIYAGSEENKTLLPSIMDGANKGAGYGRLDNEQVIADDCAQAPRFFKLGIYTVQAPVANVGANGKLEIGVYRDAEDVKGSDWIVVDNFRLYRVDQAASDTVTKVLTLTASGNGTIQYGNISVRSSSQSFDVAELSDVVLTITPDAGHHVETLTINGEDALSRLTEDGKLSLTLPAAIGTWTFDDGTTGSLTATAGVTTADGVATVPAGDYLTATDLGAAANSGTYTIMFDVKVANATNYCCLFNNDLTKDGSLFFNKGKLGLNTGGLGYNGTIEADTWYRVVFVSENAKVSVYLDGVLVGQSIYADYDHWKLGSELYFFADDDGEEQEISVDELRFWDVALTADEVGMLGACGNVASSYGGMTSSVTVAVTFANNSDLNDDGLVDVSDIMTIINNIADDIYLSAADLNNDGFVDVGDIMVVINAIIGIHDNTAGVKAMRDVTNIMPATENDDYLTISNEDNIVSIQLDNEYEYSAFQMLVTLPDGVDIEDVIFNSNRLNGFTQFARKVNERQYIIIGFSMDGNVISGSAGKILSLSITGNADDNIIISNPIFSIPDAKSYKLRVDDSYITNLQDIQVAQISVRGNTVYVHANSDTTLNIYSVSGALCEQKRLHPGVNTITLHRGQYIINNRKVSISKK